MKHLLAVLFFFSATVSAQTATGFYLKGELVDTVEEGSALFASLEKEIYPWISSEACYWLADFSKDDEKIRTEMDALFEKTHLIISLFNGWSNEFGNPFLLDFEFEGDDTYTRNKIPECNFWGDAGGQ
jgi:hypothetical protein